MDCISLIPVGEASDDSLDLSVAVEKKQVADRARSRYQFRQQRLEQNKQAHRKPPKQPSVMQSKIIGTSAERKRAVVQAAIKRAIAARNQVAAKDSP
jgi:electron transport complex protein RnfB